MSGFVGWRAESAVIIALAVPLALTQLSHIAVVTILANVPGGRDVG